MLHTIPRCFVCCITALMLHICVDMPDASYNTQMLMCCIIAPMLHILYHSQMMHTTSNVDSTDSRHPPVSQQNYLAQYLLAFLALLQQNCLYRLLCQNRLPLCFAWSSVFTATESGSSFRTVNRDGTRTGRDREPYGGISEDDESGGGL